MTPGDFACEKKIFTFELIGNKNTLQIQPFNDAPGNRTLNLLIKSQLLCQLS